MGGYLFGKEGREERIGLHEVVEERKEEGKSRGWDWDWSGNRGDCEKGGHVEMMLDILLLGCINYTIYLILNQLIINFRCCRHKHSLFI